MVAGHPDRSTRRRPVRDDRMESAPVPEATTATDGSGCPAGTVQRFQMGTSFCGPPVPTSCPAGEAPVNATASCEPVPPDDAVQCVYGDGLCTPDENEAEGDIEARCGAYDPSRVQPDGSYLPKPGC